MRPLLRWAGSKRQMLQPLRKIFPNTGALYVEPFCGSAALFFDQKPKRAVLSDINSDLINFYRCSRRQPNEVYEIANELRRTKSTYLRVRREIADTKDKLTRAAYFYYLNRNCFNGLYRTNKQGVFNVPFSKSRTGRMLSEEEFLDAAAALSSAKFSVSDFESCIETHVQSNAFFFLDPPYAIKRRKPFTEYDKSVFSEPDLKRLLGCLEAIDDAGGHFALTYDSALAHKFLLRRQWRQSEIIVRRNISGFADARKNAVEVLTTNFDYHDTNSHS
nr:Dam family site-specific DNA-(adenine-N6)-methyltransferase [Bradyrhizobium sp. CCBAU 25360]